MHFSLHAGLGPPLLMGPGGFHMRASEVCSGDMTSSGIDLSPDLVVTLNLLLLTVTHSIFKMYEQMEVA